MDEKITEEKNVVKIIKKNIKLLREKNGLSMRDTAKALGVKENTYSIWENPEKSAPKHNIIKRIADAYGVSVDLIYSGSQSENRADNGFMNLSDSEDNDAYVYGDKYLSELSNQEKVLVMQLRQLNTRDRETVIKTIGDTLDEIEKKNG